MKLGRAPAISNTFIMEIPYETFEKHVILPNLIILNSRDLSMGSNLPHLRNLTEYYSKCSMYSYS